MVFFLIALALIFDIFNGFHDAANSVATVVITHVLSPVQAVFWAAFFNFVAAFVFGTGVAQTISNKLIDPKIVDTYVIFGGLFGAIIWDIITWLMALPTSSSHAIISGYAGAAIAKAGFGSLLLKGWAPVILFLLISPVIGLLLGYCFMVVTIWLSHSRERHKAEANIQAPAAAVGRCLQPGTRHERCAKDHGNYRGAAGGQRKERMDGRSCSPSVGEA